MNEPAASPLRAAILVVTGFQQNCTLLWDDATKEAAIIDPGGEMDRILDAIAKLELVPSRIWLTHGHIDHAGAAAALADALRAANPGAAIPIEGPDKRDEFLLQALDVQGARMGIPEARPVTPDRYLTEGDTLTLGPHRFAVLHCPGHTPGHVVFMNHAARFAIVGDVLFQGSVGRTDFPYGDPGALIASIRDKLLPLGDDVGFLCGHGPASTIGAERKLNPFLEGM